MLVAAGLAVIAGLAWAYTVRMASEAADMASMADMAMPAAMAWGAVDLLAVLVMWVVMMTAMMVPSAVPMVLVYAALQRQRASGVDHLSTALFVAGYLALWAAFSVLATLGQGALNSWTGAPGGMIEVERPLGAAILVLAGLYQFTRLKRVCLAHCRGPLEFIFKQWRPGRAGAFAMGARHGAYCVGCCWPLMLLLFLAGVMNLLWIAALSTFVLGEKLLPGGEWYGRIGGTVAVVSGILLLVPMFR
ncbi:MAG: DUF2182 domain-containing protein [Proteobacteria bacterium]|nr:DUF2182 domain-containing protein [Pseudomonadota bacterium]MBI3495991.1 DUF2182 domain-containing protein [Pseudomonadota bacterium]